MARRTVREIDVPLASTSSGENSAWTLKIRMDDSRPYAEVGFHFGDKAISTHEGIIPIDDIRHLLGTAKP